MSTKLPPIQTTPGPPTSPALYGLPLLRLGFRPFYLCAALLAALAVPLWIALFLGLVPLSPAVPALLWHAHEMLFGFATAVIVGFLLTAGKGWTGLATPKGTFLGILVGLWLAARIASVVAPYLVYAVLDLIFLPVVAIVFLDVLLRSGNRRNLPMALILVLLALSNLAFHLAVAGIVAISPLSALHAGLALIVMIECVIAGRVIPAFTMSATPGLKLKASPKRELTTLLLTALGLSLWVFAPPSGLTLVTLALAAGLHLHRQWQWHPLSSRGRPILWILHAAYAWIPIGLALLALAQIAAVPVSAGLHALGVGATGGLIIGMMTRTARGHTGRPVKASRPEVTAYALVMLAAVLRVLVPLVAPNLLLASLIGAALAWALAFSLYLTTFTPWLMQTRLDGRDG